MRNNGVDLAISNNGAFSFLGSVPEGSAYAATVQSQPTNPTQTCTLANGSGTASANVNNITVTCVTDSYTVAGTVSGLAGSGLLLRLNGGNDLPVPADGNFRFAATITHSSSYTITVQTQPSNLSQTCTVTNGSGTATSNIDNVAVVCTTNRYTVGGVADGLAGTGLTLRINGGETIAVNGRSFTFPTALLSGSSYSAAIVAQPTSPWQICALNNASGSVTDDNVTSVSVSCTTNTYAIGGTVNGLLGSGLRIGNGTSSLDVSANGTFVIPAPVTSGASYNVRASAVPSNPAQECVTLNGNGVVANAAITNIVVNCFVVGRWIFVTNSNNSTLSAASIDQQTGVLTPAAGSTYSTNTPIGSAATPDGRFLYVANRVNQTVTGYAINRATGALTLVPNSPIAAGASFGAPIIDPTGRFLYAPNSADGTTFGFSIDGVTGQLTAIPGSPFASAGSRVLGMKIESTGRFAYVYSQLAPPLLDSGHIESFAIDQSSGSLTSLPGGLDVFPAGSNGRELLAISSNNDTLFVASAFTSSLRAYRIDANSGSFAALPGSPTQLRVNNVALTVLPGIPAVYVAGDPAVAVFAYGSALQQIPGSPFSVPGFETALASDPSARFLWASTRQDISSHFLTDFSVQTDGTLARRGSVTTASHMGGLTADPSGRFIFGVDSTTGVVATFLVDRDTGNVALVDGSTFNAGAGALRITIAK